MATIGLNDTVYFKFSVFGKQVLKTLAEEQSKDAGFVKDVVKRAYQKLIDTIIDGEIKNGYAQMQLHTFMNWFGSKLTVGGDSVILHNKLFTNVPTADELKELSA